MRRRNRLKGRRKTRDWKTSHVSDGDIRRMAAVQRKLALVYEVTLSSTALYYAACCTVLYVLSIWPFMLQHAQLYQLESIICPSDSAFAGIRS